MQEAFILYVHIIKVPLLIEHKGTLTAISVKKEPGQLTLNKWQTFPGEFLAASPSLTSCRQSLQDTLHEDGEYMKGSKRYYSAPVPLR